MKKDSLLRSTSLFSLATLVSRVLGLVRDAVIAAAVPLVWQDIFWAGIKIPSTFRQLFAEGALSAAFIPLLARARERGGDGMAREAAAAIFFWILTVVSAVVAVAILLAPWLVPLILAFPEDEAWKIPAAVQVTQMMFPFLLFVAFSAWAMGVLNTHNIFFMPALASAFFNIVLIAGCLFLAPRLDGMALMAGLGACVVAGGAVQFVVQLPQTARLKYFPPARASLRHPAVGEFLAKLAPAVFGLAVFQLNALITHTYFASKYGEGGISVLNYAFRLIQFPIGIVGVALATASFPRLAGQMERGDNAAAADTLSRVSRYLLLLMVPATAGLWVLGNDIVSMIYGRGEFEANNLQPLAVATLAAYAAGLVFFCFARVLARALQAQHDFKTPVRSGAAGVAVNIGLCAWFSSDPAAWPLWCLPLASSIASGVNVALMASVLLRRVPGFRLAPQLAFAAKCAAAALAMSAACWLVLRWIPAGDGSLRWDALRVAAGLGASLSVYAAAGFALFRQEIRAVLRMK